MAAYTLTPPGEVMAMALRVVSSPAPMTAIGWCRAAPPAPLARGSREGAEELRRRVPTAQVVEVPTGHNVQEQAPVLLAEIVTAFLDGAA